MRRLSLLALCFLSFLSFAQARNVDIPRLEVRVDGIKDLRGEIGVAVWNSKLGYPTHLEHAYEAEWIPVKAGGTVVVAVFATMPAGEYAVSVVHDTNRNRFRDRVSLCRCSRSAHRGAALDASQLRLADLLGPLS